MAGVAVLLVWAIGRILQACGPYLTPLDTVQKIEPAHRTDIAAVSSGLSGRCSLGDTSCRRFGCLKASRPRPPPCLLANPAKTRVRRLRPPTTGPMRGTVRWDLPRILPNGAAAITSVIARSVTIA